MKLLALILALPCSCCSEVIKYLVVQMPNVGQWWCRGSPQGRLWPLLPISNFALLLNCLITSSISSLSGPAHRLSSMYRIYVVANLFHTWRAWFFRCRHPWVPPLPVPLGQLSSLTGAWVVNDWLQPISLERQLWCTAVGVRSIRIEFLVSTEEYSSFLIGHRNCLDPLMLQWASYFLTASFLQSRSHLNRHTACRTSLLSGTSDFGGTEIFPSSNRLPSLLWPLSRPSFRCLLEIRWVRIRHYLKCIKWVIVLFELIAEEHCLVVAYSFTLDVDEVASALPSLSSVSVRG